MSDNLEAGFTLDASHPPAKVLGLIVQSTSSLRQFAQLPSKTEKQCAALGAVMPNMSPVRQLRMRFMKQEAGMLCAEAPAD